MRIRRQWGAQKVRAWQATSGEPLVWDTPSWYHARASAQEHVDRINRRGESSSSQWDRHQHRARLVTRVVSDIEEVVS